MRERIRMSFALIFFAAVVFAWVPAAAEVPPEDKELINGTLILHPGMSGSCQNDFIVENLNADEAELKLVLGEEEFLKDRIDGKKAKAYGLKDTLSTAFIQGKQVRPDDIATILNVGDKSNLRLHCME